MNTATALDIGYASCVFALATAIWRVRPKRRPSEAERVAAARARIERQSGKDPNYIGPNDPRLPAGIRAHLNDYAALDVDLAPVFAPGLDRLRQAIRDEQQKGDQS